MRERPLAKGQKGSLTKGESKPARGPKPDEKYYGWQLPPKKMPKAFPFAHQYDHESDPKVRAYLKASGLIP